MTGHRWLELGLPRESQNTARETRARFEYQDACVVLRCIPNLLPDGGISAVVIEWTTDYVVLALDGRAELVSVKHREEDQRAWSFADLARENVFRDLHDIWRQLAEYGDYVFESNRGISRALRATLKKAVDPVASEAARLADALGVAAPEAARFASCFILPPEPTPDRGHIREVATTRLASVMPQLGLDPRMAPTCLKALEDRVAAVAIDRPLEPGQRVRALAGMMREIRDHGAPNVGEFLLTMDELREIVASTAMGMGAEIGVRPPATDPMFFGRETELAAIAQLLVPGPEGLVAPVVLTGMPGVGKSALAERFAAASTKRARVLAADTRAGLLAGIYQLNPPPEPPPAPVGASHASPPARPPEPEIPDDPELLLVIDGLRDASIVAGLIPRVSRTAILITTTSPHVDDGFRHLPIDGLSRADAGAYLSRVLPAVTPDDLALLIETFGGNALGLVQGANYCLVMRITPAQYIERLVRDRVRLLDLGRAVDHPQTIGAAISTGLAQACVDPATRALAGALALLAPEPVPEWLFSKPPFLVQRWGNQTVDGDSQEVASDLAALNDPLVLDAAVASLGRHGLVSRRPGGLRMHRLVQDVTNAIVNQPALRARYDATVGLLLAALVRDEVRPSANTLAPHIAAAVQVAAQADANTLVTSYLMGWLGNRHYEYGDLTAAAAYLHRAADMAEESGLPVEFLLGILRDLVRVQRAAGEIEGALARADQWAEAARSAELSLDAYQARSSRIATLTYARRFRQAAAEQSVLAGEPEPAGRSVDDQIIDLSTQAEIRRGLGDTEGALHLVDRAIRLTMDQSTGSALADHLAALSSQASALERDMGHERIALDRQREAVRAARELGLGMPLARELHGLASRLVDNGDAEEAANVLAEAREVAEAEGQGTQLRGDFLQTAGRIALAKDDADTASSLLVEAIPLLEGHGESYRAELATAWYNLATAQMNLAEPATAAASYVKARDIEADLYGEDHPDLISTEYSIAAALNASGDLAAADEAISRCLRIVRRGGPQALVWRNRVLSLGIAIDLANSPARL